MAFDPFNAIFNDPLLMTILQKLQQSDRNTNPNIHLDPTTGAFTNWGDPYSAGEGPFKPQLAPAEPLPVNESDVATMYYLDQLHKQQAAQAAAAQEASNRAYEEKKVATSAQNAINLENTKAKNINLKESIVGLNQQINSILQHPSAAGTLSDQQVALLKDLQSQLATSAEQGVGSPTESPDKILQQNVDDELQKAGYATDPGGAIQKVREMVASEAGKNPAMALKINAYLDSKMAKPSAQQGTEKPAATQTRQPSSKSFATDIAQAKEGLKQLQGVVGGGGTSNAADVVYGRIAPLIRAGKLQDAANIYERLKPYLSEQELVGLKFTPEFKALFASGLVK